MNALFCRNCKATFTHINFDVSLWMIEKAAMGRGWNFWASDWYCPDCWTALHKEIIDVS